MWRSASLYCPEPCNNASFFICSFLSAGLSVYFFLFHIPLWRSRVLMVNTPRHNSVNFGLVQPGTTGVQPTNMFVSFADVAMNGCLRMWKPGKGNCGNPEAPSYMAFTDHELKRPKRPKRPRRRKRASLSLITMGGVAVYHTRRNKFSIRACMDIENNGRHTWCLVSGRNDQT